MTTPNMNLALPTVEVTPGPEYATENNAAFTAIDAHDHAPGKGIAIKPSGLNINSDLTIQSNDLTEVHAVNLDNLGSPTTDVSRLNQSGGNLYWTNAGGTAVQITNGASINTSSDGISRSFSSTSISSNTVIGASDTFSYYLVNTGSGVTFTLPSAAGVAAGRFYEFKDATGTANTHNIIINRAGSDTIDGATSYTITKNYGFARVVSNGTNAWELNDTLSYFPASTDNAVARYDLTQGRLQNSGVIVDDSNNVTGINNETVTGELIAGSTDATTANTFRNTTTKTANSATATLGNMAIAGDSGAASTTSGTPSNINLQSVNIITRGNPVKLYFINGGASTASFRLSASSVLGFIFGTIRIIRDNTTVIGTYLMSGQSGNGSGNWQMDIPPSSFMFIDPIAAGTYNYKGQFSSNGLTFTAVHVSLVAEEVV